MSKHKNYREESVVMQLNQKSDILIPRDTKKILLLYGPQARGDVGIKSKGKIDFLHKYHGYVTTWVTSFKQ